MQPERNISKKEKSRIKIMHAAKGLFEKYGIDDVTFTQIAKEADVCRTTVFNHFAGTRELLLAIFAQETEDLKVYAESTGLEGVSLIYALFDRLIEDTANYPSLSMRLITNAIMSRDEENPIAMIEDMVRCSLTAEDPEDTELKVVSITGAYYGLINHYHINKLKFEPEIMKTEFRRMMNGIIKYEGGQYYKQLRNFKMG